MQRPSTARLADCKDLFLNSIYCRVRCDRAPLPDVRATGWRTIDSHHEPWPSKRPHDPGIAILDGMGCSLFFVHDECSQHHALPASSCRNYDVPHSWPRIGAGHQLRAEASAKWICKPSQGGSSRPSQISEQMPGRKTYQLTRMDQDNAGIRSGQMAQETLYTHIYIHIYIYIYIYTYIYMYIIYISINTKTKTKNWLILTFVKNYILSK